MTLTTTLALIAAACLVLCTLSDAQEADVPPLRPPAVPLVTHDPYFSVWSFDNQLTDGWSRHWTGTTQALSGLVRIDGVPYRYAGVVPENTPAMKQKSVTVLPTRTLYVFEAAGVELTLTFLTPSLPDDLDVLARPVTYLVWSARSVDGKPHSVQIYFDVSGEWVVNTPDQKVVWSRYRVPGLQVMRMGSFEQPILAKSGDNLRIDWGYLYIAVPNGNAPETAMAADRACRLGFARSGRLPEADSLRMPVPANDNWPVLATAMDLGTVTEQPISRHALIAYDDVWSIELMHRRLRPYWRRDGAEAGALLEKAARDYDSLAARCEAFDNELMSDLRKVGGEKFARLAALAYRQCWAANKLAADYDGTPLLFPKENFSNGCIATVDVHYPASPFFLLLNPALLRAQLTPVLDYAGSGRWKFPFAPHDLGTYPLANGQVYGGGETSEENQMPVEECGNMLIMIAALARAEGRADYALRYWPTLQKWANYLKEKGLDPENQLCTDDFAGHLARNCNLSLKAIVALGAYGMLCRMAGRAEEAESWTKLAAGMAQEWQRMARDEHGAYRLAFDRAGTWSQKYNLVWDRLLGLGLFPPEVARAEMAGYRKRLNRYGLPLDNRNTYTKLDWVVWSSILTGNREDFEALISPLYAFLHETPDRVPMTDWFQTTDGRKVGFQARSVVGGVFIPLLADEGIWRKWVGKAQR